MYSCSHTRHSAIDRLVRMIYCWRSCPAPASVSESRTNLKVKNIICTLIAGSCLGVLTAQQGGRGPAQTWWVAETKGVVYIPPNKPLTRLADLKAMRAGQTNWTEVVVKDPEHEASPVSWTAVPRA